MTRQIKILHLSTHYEDCGVGKYQEQFIEYMEEAHRGSVVNRFFPYSPNLTRHMSKDELDKVLDELRKDLKDCDILHIQHEFSFYTNQELEKFCKAAKREKKLLIITYHTSPAFVIKSAHLDGLGPRSILHFLRAAKYKRTMLNRHIKPAFRANIVIAHNRATEDALVNFGIRASKVKRLQLPVPLFRQYNELSSEIAEQLHSKPDDIVYSIVGFMHRYKGLFDAVKALNYLPENYKLAVLGGLNPQSEDVKIYNDLTDLVTKYNLQSRVYITGFVKDDNKLNQLIRSCDMCIYPYDKVYYAGVSSASMNIAFSNHMPVIAYPVQTFIDVAQSSGAILLTNGFSYYELARSIKSADLETLGNRSTNYEKENSYSVVTSDLVNIYHELVNDNS